MTDLSRGARVRRGGRRPGWVLLTALLVLAIGASSALVFTDRVELLKLGVILALWAAVVAAFVSVIYRRQSDVDQARARDLKLVYDLQLDREISARREYELTVESQLRRELASELRAQASDEVSELRAELAALRTNLEILFDAELSERPALESERRAVRGYSEWDRENESARERINRVASVRAEEPGRRDDDSSIIDVHEEPLVPPPPRQPADVYAAPRQNRAAEVRREATQSGAWAASPVTGPERFAPPPPQPEPPPQHPRMPWPPPAEAPRQPVNSEGHLSAPGVPGSNWNSGRANSARSASWAYNNAPSGDQPSHRSPGIGEPPSTSPAEERRGRHYSAAAESSEAGRPARSRHSAEDSEPGVRGPSTRAPAMSPSPPSSPPSPAPPSSPDQRPAMSPAPNPRHRSTDPFAETDEPQSGGQSVAELLARLQTTPSEGGRRRRRED